MKNISSLQKGNKIESPKTPGGISKSLLTPCRRVGLSRNFKRSGTSPFVSPLSTSDNKTPEAKPLESKKRKCSTAEEIPDNEDHIAATSCDTNSIQTPIRNLLPRKRSKTLLLAKDSDEDNDTKPLSTLKVDASEPKDDSSAKISKVCKLSRLNCKTKSTAVVTIESDEENEPLSLLKVDTPKQIHSKANDSPKTVKVVKLSRANSKNKPKIQKSPGDVTMGHEIYLSPIPDPNISQENKIKQVENDTVNNSITLEKKSPENLTKECMVVIQKRIFKTDNKNINCIKSKPISQTLFDSDSDDVSLSNLSKTNNKALLNEDNEFQEKKPIKKLTSTQTELKPTNKVKEKTKKVKKIIQTENRADKKPAEITFYEDDDFVANKKTILIKKTYNKVTKLSKAKSTGSITQKDIDQLMARIEAKKNLLLAKSLTEETAELRNLIKKWQKGCQNALTELFDLMRINIPEKNMSYGEILQILKIPPDLVGYDSDNDCFLTPDDATIVLSEFNI